jgi:acyl-CoA synthetase (AMP-forming)/AMP-acid ligase II
MEALDLASLRGLVNCSEPVTLESQERFRSRFASCGLRQDVFWGCYAMAETTFALTHGRSTDEGYLDPAGTPGAGQIVAGPLVSVGQPLAGVELRVVSETGQECTEGTVGELWARSPFNFSGYYNNPGATTAAFQGDWYRTGDLGYRRGSHYFVYGRQKDLIIVGGVNIYPQDIETVLDSVAGIIPGRVAAFGEFDPALQSERVVVLAETALPDEEWLPLLIQCRQRLQAALQVTAFDIFLIQPGWLVKSSSGKMARRANQERWRAAQAARAAPREPATGGAA